MTIDAVTMLADALTDDPDGDGYKSELALAREIIDALRADPNLLAAVIAEVGGPVVEVFNVGLAWARSRDMISGGVTDAFSPEALALAREWVK